MLCCESVHWAGGPRRESPELQPREGQGRLLSAPGPGRFPSSVWLSPDAKPATRRTLVSDMSPVGNPRPQDSGKHHDPVTGLQPAEPDPQAGSSLPVTEPDCSGTRFLCAG